MSLFAAIGTRSCSCPVTPRVLPASSHQLIVCDDVTGNTGHLAADRPTAFLWINVQTVKQSGVVC